MSAPDVAVITAILGVILVIAQRLLPDRTQIKTAEVTTEAQVKPAAITASAAEQQGIFELGQKLREELRAEIERLSKKIDEQTARLDRQSQRIQDLSDYVHQLCTLLDEAKVKYPKLEEFLAQRKAQ